MAKYWINKDGEQSGPFTPEELQQMQLSANDYAWTSGMAKWEKIGNIAELSQLVPQHTQPAQPEAAPQPQEPEAPAMPDAATASTQPANPSPVAPPPYHAQPAAAYEPQAPAPQQQAAAEATPQCPPTNVGWAIATILLCCWPLSVVALLMGLKVKRCYFEGNYQRAQHYSDLSAWLVIASITLSVIAWPFAMIVTVMAS